MENRSFFDKAEQMKGQKAESQESAKEQMYTEVRSEIIETENKRRQYLDLYEKVKAQKDEFSTNREEYKKALKEVLAIFENEEAKNLLQEQGVERVKDFLLEHSDTHEAEKLATSNSLVEENLQSLKDMKAEILTVLGSENPDPKSLKESMSSLHWAIGRMDREVFNLSIDTPEGRESWLIHYPAGVFHKETLFEKNIKEKESKLRELYHDLGDRIDSAFLESIKEYRPENPNDFVRMRDDHKEGRHIIERGPIQVKDNVITFYFGMGYSSLVYEIKQNNQGDLLFERKDNYKALLPDGFVKIFNEKLREIDNGFRSVAESI